MEEQIKLTINSLDLTTGERDHFYVNEIQKGEERNVREWRKDLDKLVNTFSQEQNYTNIDNNLKILESDTEAQHYSKKNVFQLQKSMERISPKVINLSNIPLSSNELNVLKLGLSFTPTPKSNIPELEADIFYFIRKFSLRYHFCSSIYHDESIAKPASTFNPKPNESQELEKICKTLIEAEIEMKKATNNISSLRNGLNWFIKITTENEIIIKPADKGSIITDMSPEFYLNMCQSHLPNEEYYECIQDNDPLLKNRIITYAKKYKNLLTENEYKTLTQETYKISNFYMLP